MELSTIMNNIVSLFVIMLVGVYGSKKGFLNNKVNKGLTDILLEITLPCLILSSFNFQYDAGIKSNIIKTFYYSFSVYVIVGISSFILMLPIKKDKKTILHFANIFTNTGYIGFPILNALYGSEAVMYGSIFNVFFNIFLWTYGVMMFKGNIQKNNIIKYMIKALRNPSLIAVYLGIIMIIFNMRLPEVISKSASYIGNMTGPLSMIIVGALSYKIRVKEYLSDWTIYYGLVSKLILIPIILYFISLLINDRTIISNSIIILASMPAAAMTSIFADSFNIKREYASFFVVATTLFSMLTLPVLINILL